MSKAFTRETDEIGSEEVAPLRPSLPSGAKQYMTRAGADRLRQRLNELLEEKRLLGHAGREADANSKASLKRVEAAIQKLQATLNGVVVAEVPVDQEKVALGASVQVRDAAGEEETYQIVGLDEADPSQGRVSAASPLARALLNKRAGERVRFESPAGVQELVILNVRY